MRIAISATRLSLAAPLEERFEDCSVFVVADLGDDFQDSIKHPLWNRGSQGGVQVSRLLVERGVSVVLTGQCDPKTLEHLASAGLWVVTGCSGTVRQVLEKFEADLDGSSGVDSGLPSMVGRVVGVPAQPSGTSAGRGVRSRHRRDRSFHDVCGGRDAGNLRVGGLWGI